MKTVVCTDPGVLEVNYMWLPAWMGMNANLISEMNQRVAEANLVGLPAAEAEAKGHTVVLEFLNERFPELRGVDSFLQLLAEVTEDVEESGKE